MGRTIAERAAVEFTDVQRWVMSALVLVVGYGPACALAGFAPWFATQPDGDGAVGLWVMSGVFGLLTLAGVLAIHQRRPWSPWVLLGLLPAAASATFLF